MSFQNILNALCIIVYNYLNNDTFYKLTRIYTMSNEGPHRDWVVHSSGRLEGEVKQLNERMSSLEQRLDRLLYALLAIGGTIGVGVLLSLFGVRFGG